MRRLAIAIVSITVTSCMPPSTPVAAAPRPVANINASFDKTWTAVVDMFGERNIPIKTIEKASGIVGTDQMIVSSADMKSWADCGRSGLAAVQAQNAVYNVRVRGDSTTSTVRVTVLWGEALEFMGSVTQRQCETTNVWEQGFETAVRERAEGKR